MKKFFRHIFYEKQPAFIILSLIILVSIFLRVQMFAQRDLWGDEIYQYDSMKGDFKPFWQRMHHYGDHTSFPGEYVLHYPLVESFGMNKWGLVGPHFIVMIVSFLLLYLVARKFFSSYLGYYVLFALYGLNYNLIFHSLEFRPYAVLPFLMLASLLLAFKVVNEFQDMSLGKKLVIVLAYICLANYHAYGILIALLPLVFCFLFCSDRSFKLFSFLCCVAAAAGIIWFWYASVNAFGLKVTENSTPGIFQFIPDPAKNIVGFFKGIIGNLIGAKFMYFTLLGVPFVFITKNLQRLFFWAGFWFLLIIIPLSAILFVDIKTHYWFLQRQFIWVMPVFMIAVAKGWDVLLVKIIHDNE